MKMAPLLAAFKRRPETFDPILVHTGQHYDAVMSDVFFDQLGMPAPDIHLGVGPGSQASQTARIMVAFEQVVIDRRPDLVLVVGDVNSTIAAAVVSAKADIPLAHVEAGLRSFDRRMPEEVNRIVTDALASYLFVTEESGMTNLRHEGIDPGRTFLVGNVMIDTLNSLMPRIKERRMAAELGFVPGGYGVVTLHRPSNVDDEPTLARLVSALTRLSSRLPLVFPAHPRTAQRLAAAGLDTSMSNSAFRLIDPLPYVEFISLVADARLVLTDSGGIQEETTMLGVPCLTLRDSTERPVTITTGSNTLVGSNPDAAVLAAEAVLSDNPRQLSYPPLWDGRAAVRIAEILSGLEWQAYRGQPSTWTPMSNVGRA